MSNWFGYLFCIIGGLMAGHSEEIPAIFAVVVGQIGAAILALNHKPTIKP